MNHGISFILGLVLIIAMVHSGNTSGMSLITGCIGTGIVIMTVVSYAIRSLQRSFIRMIITDFDGGGGLHE